MRRIKYGIWCLLIVISLMAGGITAYAEGEGKAAAAREGVVRILVDWPDGYSTGTGIWRRRTGSGCRYLRHQLACGYQQRSIRLP